MKNMYLFLFLFQLVSCSSVTSFDRSVATDRSFSECKRLYIEILKNTDYEKFSFHKYSNAEVETIPILFLKKEEGFGDFDYLVTIKKRRFISKENITEVIEPDFIKVSKEEVATFDNEQLAKNYEEYLKDIEKIINFSLEHFGRRDWPDSFKDKMHQTAKDYAYQSKYITVLNKSDDSLVGSMRLIRSRYVLENNEISFRNVLNTKRDHADGKRGQDFVDKLQDSLVLEKYLELEMEKPLAQFPMRREGWGDAIGEIIEPGTLAVDKQYNNYAMGEIWIHLLASFFTTPTDQVITAMGGRKLYTYGDRASRFIYERQMGFRPLLDKNKLIKKDGIDWQVWEFTEEDIFNALIKKANMSKEEIFEVIQNIIISSRSTSE